MADRLIDLDALALRSGEAAWMEMDLDPAAPVLGGEELGFEEAPVLARVDVSRTTSGYALRLRADVVVLGTCARCLGPARLALAIDAREVDQGEVADPELRQPLRRRGPPRPGCLAARFDRPRPARAPRLPTRLCGTLRDLRHLAQRGRARNPRPRGRARSPICEAAGAHGMTLSRGPDLRPWSLSLRFPASWPSRRSVSPAPAATSVAPTMPLRHRASTSARSATARGCRTGSARRAGPTPAARSSSPTKRPS